MIDFMFVILGVVILVLVFGYKFIKGSQDSSDKSKAKIEQKPVEKKKEITYGKINLYFGSQTGTASKFCQTLSQEAKNNDFEPTIIDLNDFKAEELNSGTISIFCMATHGEGEPTDNSVNFIKYLKEADQSVKPLGQLKFIVFGLGNTQYEHYNAMGRQTNEFLEKLGGTRIYKYGEGDDNSSLEDDFNDWKNQLWIELQKVCIPHAINEQQQQDGDQQKISSKKKSQASFTLEESKDAEFNLNQPPSSQDAGSNYEFQTKQFLNAQIATVISIQELRQNNSDGSTLHLEIDLQGTKLQYKTAQNLGIYPENDPDLVNQIASFLNYDLKQIISTNFQSEADKKSTKLPFPSPISIKNILMYFCDFQGQVMKKQLKDLAQLTQDPETAIKLQFLASAEGKEEFKNSIEKKMVTLFDLLKEYNIKPTLLEFVNLTPRISPRLFTISSSNLLSPTIVHVTDSLVIDQVEKYKFKFGICSKFLFDMQQKLLQGQQQNFKIRIDFRESSFKLPEKPGTPVIMVGPGTGVAPFRAFCQEKQVLQEKAIDRCPGEFILYFGCRHENGDFIFKNELYQFQKNQIIKTLYLAFSRDQDKKVYVQDLIGSKADETYSLLFERDATLYICGSTSMGKSVQQKIIQIVQQKRNISEQEATEVVSKLEANKKLIKELW